MFRLTTIVMVLALAASACSGPSPDQAADMDDAEPTIMAAPVDRRATRPLVTPATREVTSTESSEAPSATEVAPQPETDDSPQTPARSYGPGMTHDDLQSQVQSLTVAEAWLAELEVEWDNGMTYSGIFRAWKAVSSETEPILASYDVPLEADEAQTEHLLAYYESVQGAHDEWQRAVDFIVTYITNYTPEILIQEAYWRVEDHLDEAALLREALAVEAAEPPEIVLEGFIES